MLAELREIEKNLANIKVDNAQIEEMVDSVETLMMISRYTKGLNFRLEDKIIEWSFKRGGLEYLKPRINRIKEAIRRGIL